MKMPSKFAILALNIHAIILLVGAFESHGGRQSRENCWPWDRRYMCSPFWPFGCEPKQTPPLSPPAPAPPPPPPPPAPLLPPIVLPPPQTPPPPAPLLPPIVLPPPQTPQLPLIPIGFIFADLRLALVYPIIQKFKSIITSDPLGITTTWLGPNICNYKGFFCDSPPYNASATTIASIDFNGFGLSAPTLDGFIDQFPDLAVFHANSNNFGGNVSPNIAKLPFLYELDLSNNKLTGTFPYAVLGMEGLTFLDIRFNLFTGSVPPAIFTQNLDVLFLNDNIFVSTLPETLGSTHILYLTLANNKLIGPLPRGIDKALSGLTEVLLLNNKLTGCIPYEIGFLNQATVFDASNNSLTGPLPLSLACLQNIQVLTLSSNLLYGMVPDLICQLPNIGNFSLANNYFNQVGPMCRRLIQRGVLDVSNNCIPGLPSQRSILECASFFVVPRMCPYMETYKFVPCKPSFPWD